MHELLRNSDAAPMSRPYRARNGGVRVPRASPWAIMSRPIRGFRSGRQSEQDVGLVGVRRQSEHDASLVGVGRVVGFRVPRGSAWASEKTAGGSRSKRRRVAWASSSLPVLYLHGQAPDLLRFASGTGLAHATQTSSSDLVQRDNVSLFAGRPTPVGNYCVAPYSGLPDSWTSGTTRQPRGRGLGCWCLRWASSPPPRDEVVMNAKHRSVLGTLRGRAAPLSLLRDRGFPALDGSASQCARAGARAGIGERGQCLPIDCPGLLAASA